VKLRASLDILDVASTVERPLSEAVFRKQIKNTWKKSRNKGHTQNASSWFCNKMGELDVQDRHIDFFFGRAPKSILAKHYTSKEIENSNKFTIEHS